MNKKRSDFFDSNLVYFIVICLFICIRIISSSITISSTLGYILNSVIQIGLMFMLPLFLFSKLRKQKIGQTINQFGVKKISAKAVGYSLVIGICVYLITIFIASFFSIIIDSTGYDPSYGITTSSEANGYPLIIFLIDIIITAVLPGICEEFIHRGMLCNTYKKYGIKFAILLSGLLFGLMHLNIEQFFYATIIGFLLGFIAIVCDNIIPTMIIHFLNNAIGTYFAFATTNKLFLGNVFVDFSAWLSTLNGITAFLIIMFAIIILLVVIGYFVLKLFKETKLKQLAEQANDIMKQKLREELFEGTEYEQQIKKESDDSNVIVLKNDKRDFIAQIISKMPQFKQKTKLTGKDKIFLYASLFIGITTTICTLIWGLM